MVLQLWPKFENANDVIAPQIETGGVEVNISTHPLATKFNNGILSDINENCIFPTGTKSINGNKNPINVSDPNSEFSAVHRYG